MAARPSARSARRGPAPAGATAGPYGDSRLRPEPEGRPRYLDRGCRDQQPHRRGDTRPTAGQVFRSTPPGNRRRRPRQRRLRRRRRGRVDVGRDGALLGTAYAGPPVRLARLSIPHGAQRHETDRGGPLAGRPLGAHAGRLGLDWPGTSPLRGSGGSETGRGSASLPGLVRLARGYRPGAEGGAGSPVVRDDSPFRRRQRADSQGHSGHGVGPSRRQLPTLLQHVVPDTARPRPRTTRFSSAHRRALWTSPRG